METELTKQERIIARLLAWGFTQKEIANRLFLSPKTVQTHMKNIYAKLRIRKETDLTKRNSTVRLRRAELEAAASNEIINLTK